jgi:Trk K+ transport system NAD-binding subunit
VKDKTALIFGYNKYSLEIANSLNKNYKNIKIFSQMDSIPFEERFEVEMFDLSDDWSSLEKEVDINNSIVFCVLEDEAENVFLTISLRANFENLLIVAIASNKESVHKLKMAGANKVIPIEETVAEIIADMLKKPISSKILHNILYDDSNLKIAQIEVENADMFNGEFPADIDWSRYQGIIVLSVIHKDLSSEFIYSSKSKHKPLENGDMLVVVGYEADIAEFEKKVGRRKYVNWSDWSR